MIVQTLDGDACLLWASKELLNNADGIIRQTTKTYDESGNGIGTFQRLLNANNNVIGESGISGSER